MQRLQILQDQSAEDAGVGREKWHDELSHDSSLKWLEDRSCHLSPCWDIISLGGTTTTNKTLLLCRIFSTSTTFPWTPSGWTLNMRTISATSRGTRPVSPTRKQCLPT
ncbi:hypothetical protein RvY_01879-6 [Ramazzottius varieornatus]|uniref:Uncharacterized protein n=1 Tax=Ramazzottius varieornatus TaxID=947166 RepID=A0A1D1UHW5_RAMVA|nr:hypothetical protein RvY_01879-6 [Ramazzottius varieornatus]